MKAALSSNSCPFCANEIMSEDRMQQFKLLLSTVSKMKFSDLILIDQRIKERIIETFIENFEIRERKERYQDQIETDDITEQEEEVVEEKAPLVRSLHKKKIKKVSENSINDVTKLKEIYEKFADSQYNEGDNITNITDDSGKSEDDFLTDEEINAFYNSQVTLPSELQEKVERLKSKLKK